MWWNIDEDEVLRVSLPKSPRDQPGGISFTVTSSIAPRPVGSTNRKRSTAEALERIESLPDFGFLSVESTLFGAPLAGVARALAKPLVVYETAKVGAAALVLIDPLDRLE